VRKADGCVGLRSLAPVRVYCRHPGSQRAFGFINCPAADEEARTGVRHPACPLGFITLLGVPWRRLTPACGVGRQGRAARFSLNRLTPRSLSKYLPLRTRGLIAGDASF